MALHRRMAAVLVLLALSSGVGCSPESPRFVNAGARYTALDVTSVLEVVDATNVRGTPTTDAATLRSSYLGTLRGQGGAAAEAADIITRTFSKATPGVPVYVERATFEGTPALVIVEVIGPRGGRLGDKRIWVIDDDGAVLYSVTR